MISAARKAFRRFIKRVSGFPIIGARRNTANRIAPQRGHASGAASQHARHAA